MRALRYAKERVEAAIREITRLRDSDFPHNHPKEALDELKKTLLERKNNLDGLTSSHDRKVVLAACSEALVHLFILHPYLGFILRSTNVRNSFEIYRPLLNLSKLILGPHIKLILSSEWNYSPYVFNQIDELPDYVLIGLPASESSNPLLVPLAGHELGHTTWQSKSLQSKFKYKLEDAIYEAIEKQWASFKRIFDPISKDELRSSMLANNIVSPFHRYALLQSEETFCDFLGVRIFAESYFYAFSYLVSPGGDGVRPLEYPKTLARIKNMVFAASEFGMSGHVPTDFLSSFVDDSDLSDPDHQLMMSTTDYALTKFVKELAEEADSIVRSAGLPERSDSNIEMSYQAYKKLVPTSGIASLPDIINAGWRAYNDDHLWDDKPELKADRQSILFEIVLKSIEVLEIESIIGA